jgi:hypothetical protein
MENAYELCVRLLREERGQLAITDNLAGHAVWNTQNRNYTPGGLKGKIAQFTPRDEGCWTCDICVGSDQVQHVNDMLAAGGLHPNKGGSYFVSATWPSEEVQDSQRQTLIRTILRIALTYSEDS